MKNMKKHIYFPVRKGKMTLWIFSPDSWGQQDVAVVLEIISGAVSKHDVCQDVTTKAVEHGTEPGGHGTPARNLHRACNTEEDPSVTVLDKICLSPSVTIRLCMCRFFFFFVKNYMSHSYNHSLTNSWTLNTAAEMNQIKSNTGSITIIFIWQL